MSLGVETEYGPQSQAEYLRRADHNLYRAKHEGRNRVVASPEGRSGVNARTESGEFAPGHQEM